VGVQHSPYFSFPFLASAGAYSFKRTESGYDLKDIGLDNAGAVKGLKAIINLINENVLPRGSTQSVMNQKTGQRPARYHGRPWVSIIQVCLMLVRYEQRPEDRETEGLADQAQSSRDPFQALSLEQPVGHSGFRL
jgi:hypothetical protein